MFVFKKVMWRGMWNIYGSKVGASYHKIPPTQIKNKGNVKLQLTIEKTCQSSRYLLKCPSSSNTFSTDIFWRRVCVRWLPVRLSLAGSSSWADQHQIMNRGLHESRVGGAHTHTADRLELLGQLPYKRDAGVKKTPSLLFPDIMKWTTAPNLFNFYF